MLIRDSIAAQIKPFMTPSLHAVLRENKTRTRREAGVKPLSIARPNEIFPAAAHNSGNRLNAHAKIGRYLRHSRAIAHAARRLRDKHVKRFCRPAR
jgi:hypothetical protein